MRVRGLKPCIVRHFRICSTVAPHAGAWIETSPRVTEYLYREVAPHAGAWIETRARKPFRLLLSVAPHAGAWIETFRTLTLMTLKKSHPMRVRGLKLTHLTIYPFVLCRTPCGCVD